jgi:hypothetical protein
LSHQVGDILQLLGEIGVRPELLGASCTDVDDECAVLCQATNCAFGGPDFDQLFVPGTSQQCEKGTIVRSIDDTFVPDKGNFGLGEIIGVRPEIEVLSLAVDSSADFRWRIQG